MGAFQKAIGLGDIRDVIGKSTVNSINPNFDNKGAAANLAAASKAPVGGLGAIAAPVPKKVVPKPIGDDLAYLDTNKPDATKLAAEKAAQAKRLEASKKKKLRRAANKSLESE